MSNHKPATPLPWQRENRLIFTPDNAFANTFIGRVIFMASDGLYSDKDAAYIAHACNAYPELVGALKAVTAFVQPSMHVRNGEAMVAQDNARALLAKLGEA